MRLALLRIALILSTVFVPAVACGPNLNDVHLSECLKACNSQTKTCLGDKEAALDACAPSDTACQHQAFHDTEACLTASLDCIAVCADAVEQQLKK
jgi:hypothetical protein